MMAPSKSQKQKAKPEMRRHRKVGAGGCDMEELCYLKSPIGWLRIAADEDGLTAIDFIEQPPVTASSAVTLPHLKEAYKQLAEYFRGERLNFNLPLNPRGTAFQQDVWRKLKAIPFGATISYKKLAELVGRPKGYRAVGMANNRNPLPIVVPCHRVVGADGALVGYGGGLSLKEKLLQHEGALQSAPGGV
jgi:methylated-DNA-[protein]-cysteine S-methyltransferase